MNAIYKRVWNRKTGQYVVASELAKSGKKIGGGVVGAIQSDSNTSTPYFGKLKLISLGLMAFGVSGFSNTAMAGYNWGATSDPCYSSTWNYDSKGWDNYIDGKTYYTIASMLAAPGGYGGVQSAGNTEYTDSLNLAVAQAGSGGSATSSNGTMDLAFCDATAYSSWYTDQAVSQALAGVSGGGSWNLQTNGGGTTPVGAGTNVSFNTGSGNLTVSQSGTGITYDLAPNINLQSVTTGAAVMNGNGFQIGNVAVGSGGLNNGGNRISNVADGVYANDAATVNQLNGVTTQAAQAQNTANAALAAATTTTSGGGAHFLGVNSANTAAGSNYTGDGAIGAESLAVGDTANASGQDTVAVGHNANNASNAGIAIGTNAAVSANNTGFGSIAVGVNAQANNYGNTVVGAGAHGDGWGSSSYGFNAVATGGNDIALGAGANSSAAGAAAVGTSALASGGNAVAVGFSAKATNQNDTAVGAAAAAIGGLSVAVGTNSQAAGGNSTAVGNGAQAYTSNAAAFGNGALAGVAGTATGQQTAIGNLSNAQAQGSIALGSNAVTDVGADNSIAAGVYAHTTGANASAFGDGSVATSEAVASGHNANAGADKSIAQGYQAYVTAAGTTGVAVGSQASVLGASGIAIGNFANAQSANDVALGANANSSGSSGSIAIGNYTTVGGSNPSTNSIAMGSYSTASNDSETVVGDHSYVSGVGSTALGSHTNASGGTDTAIGYGSTTTAANAVALGTYANTSGANGVAIGYGASTTGPQSIAMGQNAQASGTQSISIGTANNVSGNNSGAIGDPTTITGSGSYSLGNNNTINANNAFVVGNSVTVPTGMDGAVALGNASTAGTADANLATPTTTINGVAYNNAGAANTAAGAIVSVGTAGQERQIKNVAAGQVTATSTDAINGSQLFNTNQALGALANKEQTDVNNLQNNINGVAAAGGRLAQSVANSLGGGSAVQADGSISQPTYTTTTNPAAGTTATANTVQGALSNLNTAVSQPITFNGNTGATAQQLGSTLTVHGGATTSPTYSDGNVNTVATPNGIDVQFADAPVFSGAVTASGFQVANGGPSLTATGLNDAGQKVTNMASGTIASGSMDAVNGGQVFNNQTSVAQMLGGGAGVNPDGTLSAPTYTVTDPTTGAVTTAHDVGTALNSYGAALNDVSATANKGWNLSANGTPAANVAPGAQVNVNNGANISVTQSGTTLTVATNPNVSFTSVTTGGTVMNGSGVTNGAATLSSTGFSVAPTTAGGQAVTLTSAGLSNGGHTITNVGAGAVNPVSTDAINGAQLFNASSAAAQQSNLLATSVANSLGGGSTLKPDGSITQPSYTVIAGNPAAGSTTTVNNVNAALNELNTAVTTPLTFTGNSGSTKQLLGSTLAIHGGATTAGTYSDGNVNTVVTPNGVDVQFADAPVFSGNVTSGGSVTAASGFFVPATSTTPAVSLTSAGLNNGGNKITNVADGAVTATSLDAVNGEQLYAVEQTANKGWNLATNGGASTNVTPGGTVNMNAGSANMVLTQTGTTEVFDVAQNLNLTSVTTGATTLNTAGVTIAPATAGGTPVSLTNAGLNNGGNTITNVAAGTVAAGSTDAVNGDQLFQTQQKGAALAASTAANLGGGAAVQADGSVSAPTYTTLVNPAAGTTATANNVGDALNNVNTALAAPISFAGNDGTAAAQLGGTLAVKGGATTAGTYSDGNIKTVMTPTGIDIQMADAPTFSGTVTSGSGFQVGTTGPSMTTTGIDAAGLKVTNVAAGSMTAGSMDAVNGDQLYAVSQVANRGWDMSTNGGPATTIVPGMQVGFNNGPSGNVVLTQSGANLAVDLANDLKLGSVTTGNTVLNTNGVTISSNTAGGSTVSLTSAGLDNGGNKITAVADGVVAAGSHDVVNGEQLAAVQGQGANLAQSVASNLGGGATVQPDGSVSAPTYNVVTDPATGATTAAHNVGDALAAVNAAVSAPISFAGNDGTAAAQLGGTLAVKGGATTAGTYSDGNIKTVMTSSGIDIQLADAPVFSGTVTGAGFQVANGGPSMTSTGIDAAGTKVTGLAAGTVGKGSTDAVTGDQLYAVTQTANAGWNVSANGTTPANVAPGATLNVNDGASGNIKVTQSGTTLAIDTNPDMNLTSVTTTDGQGGKSVTNGSGLTVTDGAGNAAHYGASGFSVQGANNAPAVSLTSAGLNNGGNKLAGVGAGAVNAGSTDAVNGGQLYATQQMGDNLAKSVASSLGGGSTVAKDGSITAPSYNVVTNPGKGTTTTVRDVGDAIKAVNSAVSTPITFAANDGTAAAQLGSTLKVTGAATTEGSYSGNNIKTVATTGAVQIQMADAPVFNGPITANAGVTVPNATAGQPAVQLTGNGLNNGGNKITNVGNGDLTPTSTDAVNGGQVVGAVTAGVNAGVNYTNAVANQVSAYDRAYTDMRYGQAQRYTDAATAAAIAVGNLPQATGIDGRRSMVSVGLGHYGSSQGVTVGTSGISESNRFVYKMGVSLNSAGTMGAGASVGYQF